MRHHRARRPLTDVQLVVLVGFASGEGAAADLELEAQQPEPWGTGRGRLAWGLEGPGLPQRAATAHVPTPIALQVQAAGMARREAAHLHLAPQGLPVLLGQQGCSG